MKITKPQLSVSSIKVPKVSRKVMYITAGVVVFLALFSFAVASQVKAERADNLQRAAVAAQQDGLRRELSTLQAQNKQLAASAQFQTAKANSTCDWIRSTQAQRRQPVPPLCKL